MAETTFHSLKLPNMNTARVPETAQEFNTLTSYAIKDYCTYQGKLYRCIAAHSAGNWNSDNFTATNIDNELDRKLDVPVQQTSAPSNPKVGDIWIDSNENSSIITIDPAPTPDSVNPASSGGTYSAIQSVDNRKLNKQIIAGDYSVSATYNLNDLCLYNGLLYKCTTTIETPEAWTSGHWQLTSLDMQLDGSEDEMSFIESGVFTTEIFDANNHFYNLIQGNFKAEDGQNYSVSAIYCRTGFIPLSDSCLIEFDLPDYDWNCWSYETDAASSATHSNTNSQWVSTESPIHVTKQSNDNYIRISFARKDRENMTQSTTDSSNDWYKIQHNLHIYSCNNIDTTLSQSSQAADAKVVGDYIRGLAKNTLKIQRLSSSTSGLFSLNSGEIDATTGATTSSSYSCRTGQVLLQSNDLICIFESEIDDYEWTSWVYNQQTNAIRSCTSNKYIPTSIPIYIESTSETFYTMIGFRRKDKATMTTSTSDSSSDYYKIRNAMHLYKKGTDTTLLIENAAADAKTVGEQLAVKVDSSDVFYAYGGLYNDGSRNLDNTKRLSALNRYQNNPFYVKAGSSITANPGYAFNVALYSEYNTYNDFVLYGFRSMDGGTYTIPVDCYIKVSIGKLVPSDPNNYLELWYEDANDYDNIHFTQDGLDTMKNGLTYNLINETLKDKINDLSRLNNSIIPTDFVPLTTVEYHAMWDDLVDSGFVTRELLGYINDSEDLPVYLYKINSYTNHIRNNNEQYQLVESEIYKKPKVFINGTIHGTEKSPVVVILDLVKRLKDDVSYQELRDSFEWYIIPLSNPWGYDNNKRKNSDNIDCNRDFVDDGSHFVTTEAQFIRNAILNILKLNDTGNIKVGTDIEDVSVVTDFPSTLTSNTFYVLKDNNKYVSYKYVYDNTTVEGSLDTFAFSLDLHTITGVPNNMSTFLEMSYNATNAQKNFIYNTWMQNGAKVINIFSNYYDKPETQAIYICEPTSQNTLRNYMNYFNNYSMLMEEEAYCRYYSGTTKVPNNQVACTTFNTVVHNFLKRLGPQIINQINTTNLLNT